MQKPTRTATLKDEQTDFREYPKAGTYNVSVIAKEDSDVIKFLRFIWDANQKLNANALISGIRLAIESGMKFELNDFERIPRRYYGYEWFGSKEKEYFYSIASKSNNLSACESLELLMNREPFILMGKRIYVGAQFQWQGTNVKCTSFADGSFYLIACQYGWINARLVILKRFKITQEDLAGKRGSTVTRGLKTLHPGLQQLVKEALKEACNSYRSIIRDILKQSDKQAIEFELIRLLQGNETWARQNLNYSCVTLPEPFASFFKRDRD